MSPCQKDFDTKYYKKGMFLDGSHVLWEKYNFFFELYFAMTSVFIYFAWFFDFVSFAAKI